MKQSRFFAIHFPLVLAASLIITPVEIAYCQKVHKPATHKKVLKKTSARPLNGWQDRRTEGAPSW